MGEPRDQEKPQLGVAEKVEILERLATVEGREMTPEIFEAFTIIIEDFKENMTIEKLDEYTEQIRKKALNNPGYLKILETINRRVNSIHSANGFGQVSALENFSKYLRKISFELHHDAEEEWMVKQLQKKTRTLYQSFLARIEIEKLQEELTGIKESELNSDQLNQEIDKLIDQTIMILESNSIVVKNRGGEYLRFNRDLFLNQDLNWVIYHLAVLGDDLKLSSIELEELEELILSIREVYVEQNLHGKIGKIDDKKLEQDRMQFGAKAANLTAIIEALAKEGLHFIEKGKNPSIIDIPVVEIPDHIAMSIDVYRKWKAGEDISVDLQKIFAWTKGRSVMVRSSAVFSEDGDNLTGAGIYKSVWLKIDSTYKEFKKAVLEVFRSVDSPNAIRYREENRITEEEQMGIVVQEYVPCKITGTVDSVVRGVPELIRFQFQIRSGKPIQLIVKRDKIKEFLLKNNLASDIWKTFHYQLDHKNLTITGRQVEVFVNALVKLMIILEKFYDKKIEIEFGFDENKILNLFQSRPLPQAYLERVNVEFPADQELVFEGEAVGVGDFELDVLKNNNPNNRDKKGIVFFDSSHFISLEEDIDGILPKEGVVVILQKPEEFGGHLEMLCAERGVSFIMGDGGISKDFEHFKRCRAVLNGLEGRVYKV
jgi:hypothetical protein